MKWPPWSLERSFPSAELKYRWCQFWSRRWCQKSGTKANACHAPFWPTQGSMVILEYMSIEMLLINTLQLLQVMLPKALNQELLLNKYDNKDNGMIWSLWWTFLSNAYICWSARCDTKSWLEEVTLWFWWGTFFAHIFCVELTDSFLCGFCKHSKRQV